MNARNRTLRSLAATGVRRVAGWFDRSSGVPKVENGAPEHYPWNHTFSRLLREGPRPRRSSYLWGVLQGAKLASTLGYDRISAIELGVAGGRGLVALENAGKAVGAECGVEIDVYGFDTGRGLPKPTDHRDLPNLYREGQYRMDVERLEGRLDRAELILGLVGETIPRFIERRPAPVAFLSFDLDLYSSTMQAFELLEAPDEVLLPRVHAYFDDVMGLTCSDWNGERLAIREFNDAHEMRKIAQIPGLKYFLPTSHAQEMWSDMIYMIHLFDHPLYNECDGLVHDPELPLRG